MSDLSQKRCVACEGLTHALNVNDVDNNLKKLNNWQVKDGVLNKVFKFKNYYETMAFVNAIAWISHKENHHPDLQVGYNVCEVSYITHAINGLSDNDFICAAKIDLVCN